MHNISCSFGEEFDVSVSTSVVCFANTMGPNESVAEIQRYEFKFDTRISTAVKTVSNSDSANSYVQCGILSCQKGNSELTYLHKNGQITVSYQDPFSKQKLTKSGIVKLELKEDEYIHNMVANSEWFEITIRKKGVFGSPRRYIGAT